MLQIEKIRKERGLSQAELARQVGCSQAAICKLESGENNPSLETLVKLAQVLGCLTDDLIDKTAISSSAS